MGKVRLTVVSRIRREEEQPVRDPVIVKISPVQPRARAFEREVTGGRDSFELPVGKYRLVATANNRSSEPADLTVEAGASAPVKLVFTLE